MAPGFIAVMWINAHILNGHQTCSVAASGGADSHSGGQIHGAHVLDTRDFPSWPLCISSWSECIHVERQERGGEEVYYALKSSTADSCEKLLGLTKLGIYGREWHVPGPGGLFHSFIHLRYLMRSNSISPISVIFSSAHWKEVTIMNEGVTSLLFSSRYNRLAREWTQKYAM